MIISLSGKPGSGKSTVAKRLAVELGYERYYIGGMRRQAAKEQGMTLAEFNKLGEHSDETDKVFDEYVTKLGQKQDNFIIESRTAFHFIPHSLKIFLDIAPPQGAQRIWHGLQQEQSGRNEAPNLKNYEAVLASVRERIRSDKIRYQKYYQLNIFNPDHYDLFLDTTPLDKEQEYQAVYSFIQVKIKK